MQPIIQLIGSGAIGGGTTAVLALSQGLASRGVPIVVASERGSYLVDAARSSGLATLELDFGRRSGTPRVAVCLARALKELQPSMLHAHGARAGLPAALIPASLGVPFIYTVHGFHYPGKPFGVRALARQTERFCMYKAAATVFVSDHDRVLAVSDNVLSDRSRHTVIHNGSEMTKPTDEIEAAFDIVFLGRLHPGKNPLALADILLLLRPLEPTLAIIGAGECEAALRQRLQQVGVAHQVQFLGMRPSSEALALLAQARIMVLTSLSEGLPVSVIEAMHRGVPTVASKVGGLGELIDDGETGFLVKADDIAAFADRLRCLLVDEQRRTTMGRAAQVRARSAFSIQHNVERHLALYGHLARLPKSNEIGLVLGEQFGA